MLRREKAGPLPQFRSRFFAAWLYPEKTANGLISFWRASLTGWASSEHHSQSQILCCISGSVEKTE